MSTVVHSISENPRLRIARLVERLVLRQRLAALDEVREHLPLTDPDRHDLDRTDAVFGRLLLDAPDDKVIKRQRRAALLRVIKAEGGKWKTGRVIRLYRRLGYGPVGKQRASQDLKALRAAGHLVQHDVDGARFFVLDGGSDA